MLATSDERLTSACGALSAPRAARRMRARAIRHTYAQQPIRQQRLTARVMQRRALHESRLTMPRMTARVMLRLQRLQGLSVAYLAPQENSLFPSLPPSLPISL
jgi:hypothetical protein